MPDHTNPSLAAYPAPAGMPVKGEKAVLPEGDSFVLAPV